MANNSCQFCTERHLGCHSTCPKYAAFKEEKAKENKMIKHQCLVNYMGVFRSKKGNRQR